MLRKPYLIHSFVAILAVGAASCGDDGATTSTTAASDGGTYSLWGDEAPAGTDVIEVDVPSTDEGEDATVTTTFTWNDVAGWPAATDLTVRVQGDSEPLVQVFTENNGPFSRTGLAVEGLVAGRTYQLDLTIGRTSGAVKTVITDLASGEVVVEHDTVVPQDVALDTIEFVVPSRASQAVRVDLDEVRTR